MSELLLRVSRNEYELIIKSLRQRRSDCHWSTAIDKELIVNEFDALIKNYCPKMATLINLR